MLSEKEITKKLSEMTLEQKLGHVVVARDHGISYGEGKEYFLDKVRRGCVGGVQPPGNVDTKEFIAEVNAIAPNSILFCDDMENGAPLPGAHHLPMLMTLAAANDDELAYEFGRITAIEAKAAGYSLSWGPVVDLIDDGECFAIQRRLGDDPYFVAKYGELIAKGYMDEGLFYTAKHFPGGSDASRDDHMYSDCHSLRDEQELTERDLIPYIEMIKNSSLMGIMTTHRKFPKIDPVYPASLSEKIISIIRKHGFDGLITSDSLAMMGVLNEFGEEGCIGLAIKAGNDMIIPNYRITYEQTMKYVESAYNKGIITPQRLDDAVRRVLIAQDFAQKAATHTEISEEQIKCIERLGKKSICAITDDGIAPHIDKEKSHLFVILKENLYINDEGVALEYEPLASWNPGDIRKQLNEEFPDSDVIEMCEFPNNSEMQQACYHSTLHDDIIFITFCRSKPYGGSEGLTERILNIMEALKSKIAAIVHVGNPHTLENAPHSPRIIWGTEGGNNAKYVVDVLSGKLEPMGKMPVKLNLK